MNFVTSTGHHALQWKLMKLRWAEHVAKGKKGHVQNFDVKCLWMNINTEYKEGDIGIIFYILYIIDPTQIGYKNRRRMEMGHNRFQK